MKQITLVTLTALLFALCPIAEAQQPGKVARIGYLSAASAEVDKNRFAHFKRGMQESGYTEGHNISIEQRYAAGKFEKIPELAAELTRSSSTSKQRSRLA